MNYKAIKIPEDEFEKHKERKEQLGQTWEEYIDGQAPEGGREIAKMVVSDLEGSLPRKIAEELHG